MTQTHLTITTYSHHFAVTNVSPRGRDLCLDHARKWASYTWQNNRGHKIRVMDEIFGAALKDRSQFRFHINQLEQFNNMLKANFVTENLVTRLHVPAPVGAPATMTMLEGKPPLPHQLESIQYLAEPEPVSKLIGIQTGKGKGYVSMTEAARFGKRTVVFVRPAFMEKWWEEICELLPDVKGEDILMVRGSDNLKALIQLGKSNQLDCKFIIVSNKTFDIWLTEYETKGDYSLELGYDCRPQEFFEVVNAGLRIIDEVHLDWHFNFHLDLYTNVSKSISLSATLLSKDAFQNKTYECAYPMHTRGPDLALDKYITVYPTFYRFHKPEKLRTESRSGRGYSHDEFEKSVMKHVPTKIAYFNMIGNLYELNFLNHPRPKKTALIFFYSTEMCTEFMKYMQGRYPDRDFRRYAGSLNDPYEDLMEGETVLSTLGSSGTGIDKPNLVWVLMTNALSSVKANTQALGRLRRLGIDENDRVKDDKIPGNQTFFSYLVCSDIAKHMEYDKEKKNDFADRVKLIRDVYTGFVL